MMLQNHESPRRVFMWQRTKSSVVWFQIPNCDELLKNYYLVLMWYWKNIHSDLQSFLNTLPFSNSISVWGQIFFMYFDQNHIATVDQKRLWESRHWRGFAKVKNCRSHGLRSRLLAYRLLLPRSLFSSAFLGLQVPTSSRVPWHCVLWFLCFFLVHILRCGIWPSFPSYTRPQKFPANLWAGCSWGTGSSWFSQLESGGLWSLRQDLWLWNGRTEALCGILGTAGRGENLLHSRDSRFSSTVTDQSLLSLRKGPGGRCACVSQKGWFITS